MFNPARASRNICDEFVDYITSAFPISDKSIRDEFSSELNEIISKGPIVEISDIFKSGLSIAELINVGVLSKGFQNIEVKKSNKYPYIFNLPLDRPLYKHQEKAIRNIVSGENQVISTGTGSGKTECFLIPVLNELLNEIEAGTLTAGVRALFIYPMNALANDQLKRIRELLLFYPKITFGVYNGGTKHEEEDAENLYNVMFAEETIPELRKRLPNEKLSREEMQKAPPHILFTNYAMLEHMLLRPNDALVFENSDFKYVVLDEAHVYSGATGMETALLLRRIKARIKTTTKTQFILTSATLGSKDKDDEGILQFASNLCGERFSLENIVRAERDNYRNNFETINYPIELFRKLSCEELLLIDILEEFNIPLDINRQESEILFDICEGSVQYNSIRIAMNGPIELSTLSRKTNYSIEDLISIIFVCTKAYKNGKALINARYHFFLRALEGMYYSFLPNKKVFLNRKLKQSVDDFIYPIFELATCQDCGRLSIVGKINNETRKLSLDCKIGDETTEYFYIRNDNEQLIDEDDDISDINESIYLLCKKCGSIMKLNEKHNSPCECGEKYHLEVVKASGKKCPSCGIGRYQRFYLGNDAATSVIGTSLFDQIPEYFYDDIAIEQNVTDNDNPFLIEKVKISKPKTKSGRQFLIFSDSRQEAAYFASYMDNYYKSFIRRRGIYQLLHVKDIYERDVSIMEFVSRLSNVFMDRGSFIKSDDRNTNPTYLSTKNAWIAVLDEMANQRRNTSMVSIGLMRFKYLGNEEKIVKNICGKYKIDFESCQSLLDQLINEILRFGAVQPDKNGYFLSDEDRKYIFFVTKQKYVTSLADKDTKVPSMNWLARGRDGKNSKYFMNNRLMLVMSAFRVDEIEAEKFLGKYWEYLTSKQNNQYAFETSDNVNFVIPSQYIVISSYENKKTDWYRCDKCKKITPYNIHNKCEITKCEGTLHKFDGVIQ